jgi:putative SOS response-associated peptidase YedK
VGHASQSRWNALRECESAPTEVRLQIGGNQWAGLWEKWKDKTTGQVLRTYTILTTDPNELMEPIHNRMPVIIPPKEYERWMASTDPEHLPVDLLRPYPAAEMKAWKVGRAVGNTRNNDASLVEPLKENEASPTPLSLFQ